MTSARFLTREQVAEELNVSKAQVYALLRRKDLRAAKIGGRGIWRIRPIAGLQAFLRARPAKSPRSVSNIGKVTHRWLIEGKQRLTQQQTIHRDPRRVTFSGLFSDNVEECEVRCDVDLHVGVVGSGSTKVAAGGLGRVVWPW